MVKLELLAPAKTADIGIEAIRHGADAVYIGAPRFGARAAAGNSIEDISRLVKYAHTFNAKVYITINTLIRDDELQEVKDILKQLEQIHVDAIIVQDPKILPLLSQQKIAIHASTQMDNRTAEKVATLRDAGFEQVVLARELTLEQIRDIHEAVPDIRLEAFVHGALCVSYSGRCFASEVCFSRSANRGECAQMCRMNYELISGDLQSSEEKHHYLSLKDLCLIEHLQDLIDAGVTSFKIEGRLKDLSYVKNVTAAYHEALQKIIDTNKNHYERTSHGRVSLQFQPDVHKSFNRGFTTYFLYGRQTDIFCKETPKSKGEMVGRVKDIGNGYFTVAGLAHFSNGDGLCFVDSHGELCGFRVNKVENGRLFPLSMPHDLCKNTRLYRNYDKQFEDTLSGKSADRYIDVDLTLKGTDSGFELFIQDDYGNEETKSFSIKKELARTHQAENIHRQLSRLGDTPYNLRNLKIEMNKNYFIPSSTLVTWRREVVEQFDKMRERRHKRLERRDGRLELRTESTELKAERPLMTCKHCLKYAHGLCGKPSPPMYLRLENGITFRLEFDCRNCEMKIFEEKK